MFFRGISVYFIIFCFLFSSLSYAEQEEKIDPLVITANKMEENSKDVSISTNVFNEQKIEDLRLDSIKDIAQHTPNFSISNNGISGVNAPVVRGMYADHHSRTVSAGMYIDGVPVLDAMGEFDYDMIDVERVEVLKGPQGTLYGKSSEAGVINIITKKPDNDFKARVHTELGTDNKKKGSANFSGPVVEDKIFFGFSALYDEKEGWVENINTGDTVDDMKHYTGNAKLRFTPSDGVDVTLYASYLKYDDGSGHSNLSKAGALMLGLPELPERKVDSNFEGHNKSDSVLGAIKTDVDISDTLSLSSITSYRDVKLDMLYDSDFSQAKLMHFTTENKHTKTAQEIRLSSNGQRIKWLAGIYGDIDDYDNGYAIDSIITPMAGDFKNQLSGKSYSFFSHLSFSLTRKFDAVFGLRYDYQNMEYTDKDYIIKDEWNEVSPKIGAKFRINDNSMIYSTIAKGYLSGGFNPFAADEYLSYEEEKLISYEIGSKNSFFDNKLMINFAAYYMDIDDLHVHEKTALSNKPYTTNAGKAIGKGLELDITAKPVKGLSLNAGIGTSDVEFDEFSDEDGDYKGNQKPYCPEYTYNFGGNYRFNSGIYLGANITGQGRIYTDKANKNKRDAYQLLNLKAGYETSKFDVYLYAENIFDEEYDHVYDSNAVYSEPMEAGISLTYRF